jgi:hypothetical protein
MRPIARIAARFLSSARAAAAANTRSRMMAECRRSSISGGARQFACKRSALSGEGKLALLQRITLEATFFGNALCGAANRAGADLLPCWVQIVRLAPVFSLTASWSPSGRRFPPQDLVPPGCSKNLPFQPVTDPAGPPRARYSTNGAGVGEHGLWLPCA